MLAGCAVLAAVRRKVEETRRLDNDEQLVLIHTLGHCASGVLAANYLLKRCVDIGPERKLKSPLAGNPMSCPRIRKRIPHITSRVACNCEFPFAPDRYPTPTLHLLSPAPGRERAATPEAGSKTLEQLARRYGLLERRHSDLEAQVRAVRQALVERIRAETPGREMTCADGRYVLVEKGGLEELVWEPLEAGKVGDATSPAALETEGPAPA
jgi:hypothetical protein